MSESTEPSLPAGTTFGPYRIERMIGEGGMGCVYEATHTGIEKRVALKTLRASMGSSEEARARFLREARAAAALRHPHVVDVSDIGEVDGVAYLAMEMLDGESLAQRVERDGALPPEAAVDVMLAVCSAVYAAHEAGIVHRDLKPDNVFLSRARRGVIHPKLLDFGIAQRSDRPRDHGLTKTGTLLGTPYYMSPEQATEAKNVDARSDQYSLGVILYQCLTGSLPFEGESLYALLHAIVSKPVTPLRELRPELDAGLEAVTLKAMSRDPSERFASVQALGSALFPYASGTAKALWQSEFGYESIALGSTGLSIPSPSLLPTSVPAPRSSTAPSSSTLDSVVSASPPRPTSRVPLFVGGVVLLALAVGGVMSLRTPPQPETPRNAARPPAPVTAVVPTPPPAPPAAPQPSAPTPAVPEAAAPAPPPTLAAPTVAPAVNQAPAEARSGRTRGHRRSGSRHGSSSGSSTPARGSNEMPY